jgi:hypothetical protein
LPWLGFQSADRLLRGARNTYRTERILSNLDQRERTHVQRTLLRYVFRSSPKHSQSGSSCCSIYHIPPTYLGAYPISLRYQVAEVEKFVRPQFDPRHSATDFRRHKGFRPGADFRGKKIFRYWHGVGNFPCNYDLSHILYSRWARAQSDVVGGRICWIFPKRCLKDFLGIEEDSDSGVRARAQPYLTLLHENWQATDWTRPQAEQVLKRIDSVLEALPAAVMKSF